MSIRRGRMYYAAIAGIAASLTTLLTSCLTPREPGTYTEAIAARALINEGRAFVTAVQNETQAILVELAVVPVARSLLLDVGNGGKAVVLQNEVTTAYGLYTENATTPGTFDYASVPLSTEIKIQFLNGIQVRLLNFTFSGAPSAVNQFLLMVTSGAQTPPSQVISMRLTIDRPDLSPFTDLLNILRPTLVLINGEISYFRSQVNKMVTYRLTRSGTEVRIDTQSANTITRVRDIEVQDVTAGTTKAPFWHDTETATFQESSTTPGTYSATTMTFTYQDSIGAGGRIRIQDDPLLSTFPGIIGYNGSGFATYEGREVATVSGGAYECDITDPSNIGSGVPIVLNWIDSTNQTLMPELTLFTCAKSIMVLPTQPAI